MNPSSTSHLHQLSSPATTNGSLASQLAGSQLLVQDHLSGKHSYAVHWHELAGVCMYVLIQNP